MENRKREMVTKSYLHVRGKSDRSCEGFGLRLMFQQGESLAYVKEQMGHHSIQVTIDIYGHLVSGATRPPSIVWMTSLFLHQQQLSANITHDAVLGGQVSA